MEAMQKAPCETGCRKREFCAATLSACAAFLAYVEFGSYPPTSNPRPKQDIYDLIFSGDST